MPRAAVAKDPDLVEGFIGKFLVAHGAPTFSASTESLRMTLVRWGGSDKVLPSGRRRRSRGEMGEVSAKRLLKKKERKKQKKPKTLVSNSASLRSAEVNSGPAAF